MVRDAGLDTKTQWHRVSGTEQPYRIERMSDRLLNLLCVERNIIPEWWNVRQSVICLREIELGQ